MVRQFLIGFINYKVYIKPTRVKFVEMLDTRVNKHLKGILMALNIKKVCNYWELLKITFRFSRISH